MAFNRRETITLLVGDFIILTISLWGALIIRNFALPPLGYFEENFIPFLPMFFLSLGVFYIAGLYEKLTRPIRRVMTVRILGAQATTVAMAAILFFILPLAIAPKTILVLYLILSVLFESFWRLYRMNRELEKEDRVPAVIVGAGPAVQELYEEVHENPRYLMHFVEHIDTEQVTPGTIALRVKQAVADGVRAVVVDISNPAVVADLPALYELMTDGVTFAEFASLYEEIFDRVPLGHLDPGQLLETLPKQRGMYDIVKRMFDVLLATLASVVALPFVALAAGVLLIEGGAPFIHPERIGKGGRTICLLKLRTMLFFDDGDPEKQRQNRVTRFGWFLRKTRIDELPQLWNVLTGDLSLIGPRPELPKIVAVYEREIPQYKIRHLIAPGLSGWAQIHDYDAPRGAADVARTKKKLSLDLYYVKHRSIGLDLAIAAKSLRALLAFSGT